ncbi:MAG: hypothetical protein IT438_16750 [Phycisphaerales bacterium]|nr:hypothetical protein [Phycisphaerales bacterium]
MNPNPSSEADRERRVRAAFCALCGLEGAARRSAIASLRIADPEVAVEVESLLGFHDEHGEILDRAPMVAPNADEPRGSPLEPPGPGSLIAGWRLRSALGSGGTLIAFRAGRDSDGREASILLVRPELLNRAMIERFDRASALAWPCGEGIAQCLGAGLDRTRDQGEDRTLAYIVMELVEGVAITRFAQTRCGSDAERLALIERACRAVGRGHAQGIAHAEIASGSIRALDDGGVKVLEFGVSRLIESPIDPRGGGPATPGSAVLSPGRSRVRALSACAAPEQVGLAPAPADARMDVYALGILAIESLTGAAPVTAAPADLSRLPESVRPVIARALSRAPEDRFPDAAAMADALANAAAALDQRGSRRWWSILTGR